MHYYKVKKVLGGNVRFKREFLSGKNDKFQVFLSSKKVVVEKFNVIPVSFFKASSKNKLNLKKFAGRRFSFRK